MAIKSQGSILKIETSRASGQTLEVFSWSDPLLACLITGHGYSTGDVLYFSTPSIPTANGRVFVIDVIDADMFFVRSFYAVEPLSYGPNPVGLPLSGDSTYKLTMTTVGSIRDISATGGAADDIDVTTTSSVTKEYLIGLGDEGDATFTLFVDNADTGQAALRKARDAQSIKGITVTDSAGLVCAFPGLVKQFGFTVAANGAVDASVSVKIAAAKAWFA